MAKRTAAKKAIPIGQLKKETDRLAVQSEKAKQQMDKVQEVADTVVHKAVKVKKAKSR